MSIASEAVCYSPVGEAANLFERRSTGTEVVDFGWPFPKRCLDVAGALLLLIVSAPFLLLALLLTRLTSRGPAIYAQVRVGLNGRPFLIYKVRTMRHNCERDSGACWSVPGDGRVTALGKFLRRSKIDELPQLWNILKGDMSLVGPRPERPEFVPQLARVFPAYRDRLRVLPGLTGFAQVQLPPDTDLESVRAKLACDLCYVRHESIIMDVKILLATPLYLLGVPFALTRRVLGLPDVMAGEVIQTNETANHGLPVPGQVA